ncbi:MAG: DUF4956 domain-containing protein [Bacteroidales bacterium]|nr:DUF4956 domain-containing protein [Bacteroidales bacterium]
MTTEKFLLFEALIDFAYTIILVLIISGLLYYRRNGKKTFFFTYVMVSAIIFQLCMMLARVPMELGFAIGLFAIFGIIRYRTSPINPREMTYLLVCAGIAAKNALAIDHIEYFKIVITDAALLGLIILMELVIFKKSMTIKTIVYSKLDLLHEDLRPQLISDLETSFGIKNIEKIQVGRIDTIKNSAVLKVHFQDTGDQHFSEEY